MGAGAVTPSAMYEQQTLLYPPCYLVGARASGKSAMGALLAQALNAALEAGESAASAPLSGPASDTSSAPLPPIRWCCLDTDDLFVRAFDESIADFVARLGWTAFRKRESQALRAATAPATVLATGGGCVLDAANRQFMREQGCVLYMCAPAEVLVARLQAQPLSQQRPPLSADSTLEAEVAQVLAERDPLYRESAHAVIDASGSVPEVLRDLLQAYSSYLSGSARTSS